VRFIPSEIADVILIEPDVLRDARGFFVETYHETRYRDAGIAGPFVQDNHSFSRRGTLRGLHSQRLHPQGKLVRCVEGAIFDVAVDARRGSPDFGRWVGFEISSSNFRQLWVPPGFLHGFAVISEVAQVEYKCTVLYQPGDELGVIWNDPDLAIAWPISSPVLSSKDQALPRLAAVRHLLPAYAPPAAAAAGSRRAAGSEPRGG
jgi:dTDP-4-dehydrorhamnose 3,5-epimerase